MSKIAELENEIKERQWTAILSGSIIIFLFILNIIQALMYHTEKYKNWEGKYQSAINFIKSELPTESEDEILKTIQDIIEVNARNI